MQGLASFRLPCRLRVASVRTRPMGTNLRVRPCTRPFPLPQIHERQIFNMRSNKWKKEFEFTVLILHFFTSQLLSSFSSHFQWDEENFEYLREGRILTSFKFHDLKQVTLANTNAKVDLSVCDSSFETHPKRDGYAYWVLYLYDHEMVVVLPHDDDIEVSPPRTLSSDQRDMRNLH